MSAEDDVERIKAKLATMFAGMEDELKFAGEQAAEGIVQATLAGVGENDSPFAPYSKSYQDLIDAVGGKPQGVVNMRGVFLKEGQKDVKYRSAARRQAARAGRRAYVTVRAGGSEFTARTRPTRTARGLNDSLSEMSLDLITVEATDTSLRLTYSPRDDSYMIQHNDGTGKAPQRKWFTLNRSNVKAQLVDAFATAIRARVARFNLES
jgi:hypothetical protein